MPLILARLVLPLSLLMTSLSASSGQSGFVRHEELPIAGSGAGMTMDLFLPVGLDPMKPIPAILVVQGGGFRPQDGKRFHPFAVAFARGGFAAATFGYRGRPDVTIGVTLGDVRAAFAHLRSIAPRHGIDPDRIGVFGRSAGATLAALLATTSEPEDAPRAFAGVAGVYDFVARFSDPVEVGAMNNLEDKQFANGDWIGSPFSPEDERWLNASAVNHVDATVPPMLLMHARDDDVVFWRQSERMAEALRAAGHEPVVLLFDDGGHGCGVPNDPDRMGRVVAFFREKL